MLSVVVKLERTYIGHTATSINVVNYQGVTYGRVYQKQQAFRV